MSDVENWREWLRAQGEFAGRGVVAAAVERLWSSATVQALWISGSRATGQADEHSDTDIRIHAPNWKESDFREWIDGLAPAERRLVRLSKLGPALLNYECQLGEEVAIDLLVFASGEPVVSRDSVIFKGPTTLRRQDALQVVREAPIGAQELRHLLDGAAIDQKKFEKLFRRGERLGAWFLLEAVRFALLRLAYVAVRGVDCGPKPVHTLASLKQVRRRILDSGGEAARGWVTELESDGTLEEQARRCGELLPRIAAAVSLTMSGEARRG